MTGRDTLTAGAPISAGLDLFAAAWLQQWTDAGGSVGIGPDGKAYAMWPEYSSSAAYRPADTALPEFVEQSRITFGDGHYCGTMRALHDLLRSVPCGWEAGRRHMVSHGLNMMAPAKA